MNAMNSNQQVAVVAPPSMPLPPSSMMQEFDLTESKWRVLVDQLYPAAKEPASIAMALAYCRSRNLDIFKKPVHIVPMYSSALKRMVETVWPGIAEIRTTATRTGQYAGIDAVEFGPERVLTFQGEKDIWENRKKVGVEKFAKEVRFPEWASVVVYRMVAGQKCAYHAKVFWQETYASIGKTDVPNEMWAKRPRGQLDKCVEAAALRKAFPEELGNTYAAEEMEGRTIDHVAETPQPPVPPKPPVPPSAKQEVEEAEIVDNETGEIIDEREIVTETGEDTGAVMDEGEIDDTAFFEQLEADLAVVSDMESLEEVWNDADPLARFDGKPSGEVNQGIAMAIRKRAEKRIGAAK